MAVNSARLRYKCRTSRLNKSWCFAQQIPGTDSTATVYINFGTYNNLELIPANSSCCRTQVLDGDCASLCNCTIDVCLGNSASLPCGVSRANVGYFSLRETMNNHSESAASPFSFALANLQGSVLVTLYVNDTVTDPLADLVQFQFNSPPPVTGQIESDDYTQFNLSSYGLSKPSLMTVSVAVACDRHYFTDTCDVYCQDSDNCQARYTCDPLTGSRNCLNGWLGPYCNISLAGGQGCGSEDSFATTDTVFAFMENEEKSLSLTEINPAFTTDFQQANSFAEIASPGQTGFLIPNTAEADFTTLGINTVVTIEPRRVTEITTNMPEYIASVVSEFKPSTSQSDQNSGDESTVLVTAANLTLAVLSTSGTSITLSDTAISASFMAENHIPTVIATSTDSTEASFSNPDNILEQNNIWTSLISLVSSFTTAAEITPASVVYSRNLSTHSDLSLQFVHFSSDEHNAVSQLREERETIKDNGASTTLLGHGSDHSAESVSGTAVVAETEKWNSLTTLSTVDEIMRSIESSLAVSDWSLSILASPTIGAALSPEILNPGQTAADQHRMSSVANLTDGQMPNSFLPSESDEWLSTDSASSISTKDWSLTAAMPGTQLYNLIETMSFPTHATQVTSSFSPISDFAGQTIASELPKTTLTSLQHGANTQLRMSSVSNLPAAWSTVSQEADIQASTTETQTTEQEASIAAPLSATDIELLVATTIMSTSEEMLSQTLKTSLVDQMDSLARLSDVTMGVTIEPSVVSLTQSSFSVSSSAAASEISYLDNSNLITNEMMYTSSLRTVVIEAVTNVMPSAVIDRSLPNVTTTPDITPVTVVTETVTFPELTPAISEPASSNSLVPAVIESLSLVTSSLPAAGETTSFFLSSMPAMSDGWSFVTPTPDLLGTSPFLTSTPGITGSVSPVTSTPTLDGTGEFVTYVSDVSVEALTVSKIALFDTLSFFPHTENLTGTRSLAASISDQSRTLSSVTWTPEQAVTPIFVTSLPQLSGTSLLVTMMSDLTPTTSIFTSIQDLAGTASFDTMTPIEQFVISTQSTLFPTTTPGLAGTVPFDTMTPIEQFVISTQSTLFPTTPGLADTVSFDTMTPIEQFVISTQSTLFPTTPGLADTVSFDTMTPIEQFVISTQSILFPTPTPGLAGTVQFFMSTPELTDSKSVLTTVPEVNGTVTYVTSTPYVADTMTFIALTPETAGTMPFVASTLVASILQSSPEVTNIGPFVTAATGGNEASSSSKSLLTTTEIWLLIPLTLGITAQPSLFASNEMWSSLTGSASDLSPLIYSTVSATEIWNSALIVGESIQSDVPESTATHLLLSTTIFTAIADLLTPMASAGTSAPAVIEWSLPTSAPTVIVSSSLSPLVTTSSVTPELDATAPSSLVSVFTTMLSVTLAMDVTSMSSPTLELSSVALFSLTPLPEITVWPSLTQLLTVTVWSSSVQNETFLPSLTPLPSVPLWTSSVQNETFLPSLTPLPSVSLWTSSVQNETFLPSQNVTASTSSVPNEIFWPSLTPSLNVTPGSLLTPSPDITSWASLTSAPDVPTVLIPLTSLSLSASFLTDFSSQSTPPPSASFPVFFTPLDSTLISESLYTSAVAAMTTILPTVTTETPYVTMTTATADTTTTTTPRPVQILGELFIAGALSPRDYPALMQIVRESLMAASQPALECCYSVVTDDGDLYFDANGNSLLRLEYTISPPAGLDLTSVDRTAMIVQINGRLNTTEVFRVSGNHVYQGSIFGPDVSFNLDIVGMLTTDDYTQIEEAVTVTWGQKNTDCECLYQTSILHGGIFTGKYGLQLTRIYYTMSRNGILQSTSSTEKPALEDFVASFKRPSGFFQVYQSTDAISYDLHFEAALAEAASFTSPAGVARSRALVAVWTKYLQDSGQCVAEACNVNIRYGKPLDHYTNNSDEIVNLIYYVALNNNIIKPTTIFGPSLVAAGPSLAPCSCQSRLVLSLAFQGHVNYFKILPVIRDFVGNDSIVIRRDYGYDVSGKLVTRVIFKPVYFNTIVAAASQEDVRAMALQEEIVALNNSMPISRRYQLVLEGLVDRHSTSEMGKLIQHAWTNNNKDLVPADLDLSIVKVDSESSVKPDGSPVTVVDYTVSVEMVDSALTILEAPLLTLLQASLSGQENLTVCDCETRAILNITARGSFQGSNDSFQFQSLEAALKGAWDEANTKYTGNITVVVLSVEATEEQGTSEGGESTSENERKKAQILNFFINLTEGQSGVTDLDLFVPEANIINEHFQRHNLDLLVAGEGYNSKEYMFPWYIPAGAVLAVIILLVMIYMFYRILQDQRNGEKDHEGEDPKDFLEDSDNGDVNIQPMGFENAVISHRETRTPFSAKYVVNAVSEGQTEL